MRRLLSLVSDLYLAELALPEVEVSAPDPMITVEDLFGALHELMLNHPVLALTMSRQPLDGPVGWRFAEHALAVLTGHGIDPVAAGRLFVRLLTFTVGFTLIQRGHTPRGDRLARGPTYALRADSRRSPAGWRTTQSS